MKKKITFLLIIAILLPYASFATPLDFSGGVQNEHTYEEYTFITGEPVKLSGTYSVNDRSRGESESISYKFVLQSDDGKVRLNRTMSYKTDAVPYMAIGQTTTTTEVDGYKETITTDGKTYVLSDYQFSKSDIIDSRPASDFYEGNIIGRKFYKINGDEGTVTIDMSGGNVGYENFWGSTETQIIDHTIVHKMKERPTGDRADRQARNERENSKDDNWSGTFSHQVSDSLTKSLRYAGDSATSLSTIDGGHARTTNQSVVSKYNYNINGRSGSVSLNEELVPKVERLIVPKFRDVNGHWAEDNIKKLYSLDVFDDDSSVFAPDAPMNRMEFTKAVVKASDIRVELDDKKKSRRRREPKEEAYFADTSAKDEDYKFIKAGVDKKIIEGVSSSLFAPNDFLTRAQAITILMRSLGYEEKAPNPGYKTSFVDDGSIPNWAKDSIYMGREIGLVSGDDNNNVNPNQELTRAEASTLIINYLEFLEKGLQQDYRENIIKYN